MPGATPSIGTVGDNRLGRDRWRAGLLTALVVVVVLGCVLTMTGIVLVSRSWPQANGALRVRGLHHSVQVLRGGDDVAQVYASDPHDLLFAQGYLQAEDRFWEMDVRRHISAGRLAELFGSREVDTDAFVRTMGWRQVAERSLPLLSPATRRALQDYADGVNAWLRGHRGSAASLEYFLLSLGGTSYHPEPWTPVDSLSWLEAMAWDLRSNVDAETTRALLAGRLPVRRVEQLYPPYPYGRNVTITAAGGGRTTTATSDAEARYAAEAAAPLTRVDASVRRLSALLGPTSPGIGSNAWVVAGTRTTTGRPLLANDPHLAPQLPSTWYRMGLHCVSVSAACPYDVTGFTFSGMPGVVIGHNARVSWGFTNLGADVSDLYLEKLDGDRYLRAGRWQPLAVHTETVRVAGGTPVRVRVRWTDNGPLLSDRGDDLAEVGRRAPVRPGSPARDGGYAVALRWTALQPSRTADAVMGLDTARDWSEFRRAASLFDVPAQNLVYADVDGHIGYQAPGRIPVRGAGDGRWPAPGWDPAYDWKGWVPFSALPSLFDPPSGFIVTANNAAAGPRYPYLLTGDWDYGYRATRITALIRAAGRLDAAAMTRIQLDTWNANAAFLVPYLRRLQLPRNVVAAQALLANWDDTEPADSAPAAYFSAVWRALLARTFHDELPKAQWPDGGTRWFEVVRRLVAHPTDPWWDDVRTTHRVETRDDILRAAMIDGYGELRSRLGSDPRRWRWGALHTLALRSPTFGDSGVGPVEALFNRGPYPIAGSGGDVDATSWDAASGYAVDWAPSMRMVVDLADLNRSTWVDLTGQSGHVFDRHYDDMTPLWQDGRMTAWPFTRAAVGAQRPTPARLVLAPA